MAARLGRLLKGREELDYLLQREGDDHRLDWYDLLATAPLTRHTHVQQVADVYGYTPQLLMDLDRGLLAKIDRRLLADLDHEQMSRMVRVPVSEAMWATWRRYCAAVGLPMGRAIAELITRELQSVAASDDPTVVFMDRLESRVLARELDGRERRLEKRERSVRQAEQRLRARTMPLEPASDLRVGRNEPCPCGSGVKYKRCHGL